MDNRIRFTIRSVDQVGEIRNETETIADFPPDAKPEQIKAAVKSLRKSHRLTPRSTRRTPM